MPIPVYIRENSWFAAVAARKMKSVQLAIVWHRSIHLYNTSTQEFMQSKSWVLHELKHVEQYNRYGTLLFVVKYLYFSMRYGYFNNPLEQEARAAENDSTLPEKYRIVI